MDLTKADKKTLNAAFNALDEWRAELAELTERRSREVFGQLADAAQIVGWPSDMVETSKEQLLEASKAQTEMMRHMVESWRSNVKSSSARSIEPMTSTIGHALAAPPVQLVKIATVMPQFWMQAMGTWQKNWSDAMGVWMGGSEVTKRISRASRSLISERDAKAKATVKSGRRSNGRQVRKSR
jgi:hypothetical protein